MRLVWMMVDKLDDWTRMNSTIACQTYNSSPRSVHHRLRQSDARYPGHSSGWNCGGYSGHHRCVSAAPNVNARSNPDTDTDTAAAYFYSRTNATNTHAYTYLGADAYSHVGTDSDADTGLRWRAPPGRRRS